MGKIKGASWRFMLFSTIAFVMLLGLFGMGFLNLAIATRQASYRPLGNFPIQRIENPRNADGLPEVRAGELLLVEATKCNDSDHTLPILGNSNWVIEKPFRINIPNTVNVIGLRPTGCATQHFRNILPTALTTGEWYLTGREVVEETVPLFSWWDYPVTVTQTKTWRTETFRVVGK